jgi:DNA polymerase-3 subunit delta'
MVSREEEGRNANEITIQQIREAQQFLSYKPFYNLMKIVIVQNAEKMTLEAQNCFLKTLEEPKGRTIIFLITPKPDLLLPTVSSRCQEIKFFYKGKHEILKEEEIIFNDLMKIIKSELAEKFRYAKNVNLEGENFNKVISVLRKYFRQMMLSKVGLTKSEVKNYSVEKLRKIIDLIEDISRQSVSGNINNKMALEILLMET